MPRIAIACQGGGSHRVYRRRAADDHRDQMATGDFEIVALSGTSGGAIDALLAWYGLLIDGGATALDRLGRFWREGFPNGLAARLIPDRLANAAFVATLRLPVSAGVSPYTTEGLLDVLPPPVQQQLRPWLDAQTGLRRILEAYVDFAGLPELVARDQGRRELFVGAVNVLTGDFTAFQGTSPAFQVDCVVASGTLPELTRATVIETGPYAGVYWDGLYSNNPPLTALFNIAGRQPEERPDEIWVIRINPRARATEPRTLQAIFDRRNELAGNQSLESDLQQTRFINRLVNAFAETRSALAAAGDDGALAVFDASPLAQLARAYKAVALPGQIGMSPGIAERLDYASKFNRDPGFLEMLIEDGEKQGRAFLDDWRQNRRTASAAAG